MAMNHTEHLPRRAMSVYKLVVVAAKRAKALSEGAPRAVETDLKKVTSIALEEIRQGKISWKEDEVVDGSPRGTKSKKRASKGKKS